MQVTIRNRLSIKVVTKLKISESHVTTRSSATAQIARRSTSYRVTNFDTNQKPICNFILVNTINLIMSHTVVHFAQSNCQIIAFDKGMLLINAVAVGNLFECYTLGTTTTCCQCHLRVKSEGTAACMFGSGVTEQLEALGHIDTRGPFTMSRVTLMSV